MLNDTDGLVFQDEAGAELLDLGLLLVNFFHMLAFGLLQVFDFS